MNLDWIFLLEHYRKDLAYVREKVQNILSSIHTSQCRGELDISDEVYRAGPVFSKEDALLSLHDMPDAHGERVSYT